MRSSAPRTIVSSSCAARLGGVERLVQRLDAVELLARDRDDQIAALEPGPVRSATALDCAHQDPVALGQPDRPAQPPRDPRRGDRHAQTRTLGRLAATQLVDALARGAIGRHGQNQAAVRTHRVDPEQAPRGVDQRTAGRATRQRRRVLDRAADSPPAGAPEAARGRRHEPGRDPESATPGICECQDGASDRHRIVRGVVGPLDRLYVRRVDLDHREVEVLIGGQDLAGLAPAVVERDGRLVAPQVVGVGEDPALSDHEPGTSSPSLAEPDHLGTGPLRRRLDRAFQLFNNSHFRPFLAYRLLTCNMQVTTIHRHRAYDLDVMTDGAIDETLDVPTGLDEPSRSALADALATIGDRWTLLLIAALLDGPRRFGDLQDEVGGIAPNVLTQRLRQLERNALVVARPYSERPPRFVYELSSAGRELAGALRLIAGWGARNAEGTTAPRHAACGTPMEARWWCPTCERTVDDDEDEELHFA